MGEVLKGFLYFFFFSHILGYKRGGVVDMRGGFVYR